MLLCFMRHDWVYVECRLPFGYREYDRACLRCGAVEIGFGTRPPTGQEHRTATERAAANLLVSKWQAAGWCQYYRPDWREAKRMLDGAIESAKAMDEGFAKVREQLRTAGASDWDKHDTKEKLKEIRGEEMTHDEMIAVIQAHKVGRTVEFRQKGGDRKWDSVARNPAWNFAVFDYRVKPEPREWWVCLCNGLNICSQSVPGAFKVREVIE